ncbi:MAG: hypothetical protein M3437_13605 [Chloroflexota bacterium]|nr:hypothetical protein [Chloroflexota bacterium]MDQ5867855.1 hypothetical protein [Chloroflexota bacterium]
MPLGGSVYGEPVLAKHNDGHLEVFVIGLNGHLWRKHQAGPGQAFVANWTEHSINFTSFTYSEEVLFDPLNTRLSWAIHQNGSMYVFGRTVRGRIVYTFTGSFPTGWSDWKSISAIQDNHPAMGNPVVASATSASDSIFLAVRGKGGNVLSKRLFSSTDDWGDANNWSSFGGVVTGDPVVSKSVSGSTVQTSIYVRRFDHCLHWVGESVGGGQGVAFGDWRRLFDEGFPAAKLSGAPVTAGPVSSIVWRGSNGNLWTIGHSSFGTFGGVVDLGFASASDPAIAISGGNSWLFWRSPAGQLMMQRRRAGGSPETPVSLTNNLPVRVVSKPSASTSPDGRVQVVFVGTDSAVYHLWETGVGTGTFQEGP